MSALQSPEFREASFLVRRARLEDAPAIAWHRARMFQDMGEISSGVFDDFVRDVRAWLERALASGEYVGWLGVLTDKPDVIAGGAGVQLRQVAPHPCRPSKEGAFAKGRHAIVLNVFTEPEWRRRGLARLLMEEILSWAGRERLDRLVLHASDEARALYEQMGFVATNEMRYEGSFDRP
jgi:GNAT superfamily N-acetyltransferase